MKKNLFEIHTEQGSWWKGSLVINYNLMLVAKLLMIVALLIGCGLVLYWLAIAGWSVLCWLASIWPWLLGILAVILLMWMLASINWKKVKMPHVSANTQKWIWRVLVAAVLLLLLILGIRSCVSDNDEEVIVIEQSEVETVTKERFNKAFDYVVTSRAYLDGVQGQGDKINRALVGLKYVDGKPVTPKDFTGKTYDEAIKVVAADWQELVVNSLNGQKLSDQQLVVITLFAMRNGKYGYLKSDFLAGVQQGEWEATKMAIHKSDGSKRVLGAEGRQYLWVLKNLADGNLKVEELLDFPMFSYKSILLIEMYDNSGTHMINSRLKDKLTQGEHKTPRQALEL